MAGLDDREVLKKTIYAEARSEPLEGQQWVAWVIKNRARLNREYWGGGSIKNVCLKPGQFECWNGRSDIEINEPDAYQQISQWVDNVFDADPSQDPTGGADHYNNPDKEGYPPWTQNCQQLRKIANHQFYKGP
jgi:N-acetylmuramoyl-L-alanine amidase